MRVEAAMNGRECSRRTKACAEGAQAEVGRMAFFLFVTAEAVTHKAASTPARLAIAGSCGVPHLRCSGFLFDLFPALTGRANLCRASGAGFVWEW